MITPLYCGMLLPRSEHKAFIEHSKPVTSVAFSPNGKLLASTSLDGYVRLWPVSSEGSRISLRHGGWVESVAFSSDGKTLVSGGGDQEGFRYLMGHPSKTRYRHFLWTRKVIVESVAFSPRWADARLGKLVITLSNSGILRVSVCVGLSLDTAVSFTPLHFHQMARCLQAAVSDNTIKLWQGLFWRKSYYL